MKEGRMKIEEYMQKHPSVQTWFLNKAKSKKPYEPSTKKEYVEWMELWCSLTGKTPDELASCKEIDEMRGIIAEGMRKHPLSINSVTHRLNALNRFWHFNGRHIKDRYGGIPESLRKEIKRERAKILKRSRKRKDV